jgi:hypothetical protein
MNIDEEIQQRLVASFSTLNSQAAAKAFPPPTTLSKSLEGLIPSDGTTRRNVESKIATYFSTAAVEIWLRSVHSFLVSAALTDTSPIWASVSGYYSSHYAVRSLAHLLGHFQLYKRGKVVEISMEGQRYYCSFRSKNGRDAEHKMYWRLVKSSTTFQGDGFFSENLPDVEESDIRHRNHANYSDHIFLYPQFKPLDEDQLKDRIEYISKIVFDAPPLPRFGKFPDLEFVQLIAYHRLVRFRKMLDEALGGKNRFWNVHRNPAFAKDYIDFQLAKGDPLNPFS